jgi:hypothetical protein
MVGGVELDEAEIDASRRRLRDADAQR